MTIFYFFSTVFVEMTPNIYISLQFIFILVHQTLFVPINPLDDFRTRSTLLMKTFQMI